jgi:hypothetical protein
MADTLLKTFDPLALQVIISRGGSNPFTHTVSGYAEDSHVQVARAVETFVPYTGADNTPSRVRNPNTSCNVTISLAQTSNTNAIFSQLAIEDAASGTSETVFSFTIKDNSGQTLIYAEEAYIQKVPDATFGTGMNTRDWVITATRSDYFLGGNSRFTPEDAATFEALGGVIAPQWQPV